MLVKDFCKRALVCAMILKITVSLSQQVGRDRDSVLTLGETLELAGKRSLDAFRAKRQYAISYWQLRSFKSRLLPKVDLELEPLTYNRAFVERYDADQNIDVYRLQQNLNSFAQVSISQNIMLTGAKVYISSSFNRLINYNNNRIENYSTTPVRIGLQQPLMAFNALKWEKKTALLEFEKAKKQFIYDLQAINLETVRLFFSWALAHTRVEIARENKENSQRLNEIGKKRYDLGSIEKDEVLNLELESFTARTKLTQARQALQEIISDLKLYLAVDELTGYMPQLPEIIYSLNINVQKAQRLSISNNPDLLNNDIKKINAEKDLDRVIKENRFDLSINASYGLNQQANTLYDAYQHFLDQQIVSVRFSMPLLDWGERKGNVQTAKMTKALADIEIEQAINNINRQLLLAVNNFNLQEDQVAAALKSRDIARESYKITEKRFLSGKVDLLRLTSSRQTWQSASEAYIQQLEEYWNYYYQVQQLTLYDFSKQISLKRDFDKLLGVE